MRTVTTVFLAVFFIFSCASIPANTPLSQPQEILIKIQGVDMVEVKESKEKSDIVRSMEVPNPRGRLSQLSFIIKDKAFIKIFSGLSIADVTRLWNDLCVLECKD